MDPYGTEFFDLAMGPESDFDMAFPLGSSMPNEYAAAFPSSNEDINRIFDDDDPFAGAGLTPGALSTPAQQQESFRGNNDFQSSQQMDGLLGAEFPSTIQPMPNTQVEKEASQSASTEGPSKAPGEDIASAPAAAAPPRKKRQPRKRKKQPSKEEEKIKRLKFLERNRLAASKCRTKRKDWTTGLEERLREFSEENSALLREAGGLLRETRLLREEIMRHKDCDHLLMVQYVVKEAKRIAETPEPRFLGGMLRSDSQESASGAQTRDLSSGWNGKEETNSTTSRRQSVHHESIRGPSGFDTAVSSANNETQDSSETSHPASRRSSRDMSRQTSVTSAGSGGCRKFDSGISNEGTPEITKLCEVHDDEGFAAPDSALEYGNIVTNPQAIGLFPLHGFYHPAQPPSTAFNPSLGGPLDFQGSGPADLVDAASFLRSSSGRCQTSWYAAWIRNVR